MKLTLKILAILLSLGALLFVGRVLHVYSNAPNDTPALSEHHTEKPMIQAAPLTSHPQVSDEETEPDNSVVLQEPATTAPTVTEPVTEPTEVPVNPEPKPTEPTTEPPHVHAYNVNVVSPSCINDGYSVYCCNCGDNYTAHAVGALGHQWSDWSTTQNATLCAGGKQSRTCMRCNQQETRNTDKLVMQNTGTITVPSHKDILDYLVEPQSEDFGKYYDNAMKLYNAFMTQQEDWCYLFFAEDTYTMGHAEWSKLKKTFEEKCFQNCGVLIYAESYTTGAFPEGAGLTRMNIHVNDTQALYTKCCDALEEMGLYTGMSQYEAVLTINEWMRSNLVYERNHCTPLVALSTGKAQCAGYASLFEYLCEYTGIDTTEVTGCAGHKDHHCQYGCHAWNRVQLDGTWYYLDVCWNDSSNPNRYFLTQELWAGRKAIGETHNA